jgi:hypothetical protein
MDRVALQNQFYSFYGASIAPFDMTILASSPELLILIDFITQYECHRISQSANIGSLLKSVPATPDGLGEAFASYLLPLSEKYAQQFQKTPALSHLGENIFTILQLNIIIRIACCLCITIIKQGAVDADLLAKLNEFSGLIGLFHNSQRGPMQIPAALITEIESSVSVIEGPVKAANSGALTRKGGAREGGVRRKLRKTRRQQKGGGKLLAALLSLFGVVAAAPAPAAGSVLLNSNRGVFVGANIPRGPVAAGGAGASAALFSANAGPGFAGWAATTEVVEAVDSTFATLLANTANISANLPYAETHERTVKVKKTLSAENFAAPKFPEVSSAAFTVTTAAGNHTVLDIFSLPPVPGTVVNVISLNTLGISAMKLTGLQYLSNTVTEISAVLTSHTAEPITSGGLNKFQEIGVGSDSLVLGTRTTVAASNADGSNRVGFYHAHPVIFDRLHSFGSSMDWDGFITNALLHRGSLNIISTQTGLLVYTFHPEILKGIDSPSFRRQQGSITAFRRSVSVFSPKDVPLVLDSNDKLVNTWIHELVPGRYKVVAPCSNETYRSMESPPHEGCLPSPIEVVMGGATISIPYLFDIALIPYQLVLQGLANIPIYSLPDRPPSPREWSRPMASSRGFTMSANATAESLVLRYQVSNNVVVPNIPRLFSADISCFRPESILRGFQNYQYQQRCLFQIYKTHRGTYPSSRRDISFYSAAQSGPWKLGDEIVAGAIDPTTQSAADIAAIIGPGLAAIQRAFTTPEA